MALITSGCVPVTAAKMAPLGVSRTNSVETTVGVRPHSQQHRKERQALSLF